MYECMGSQSRGRPLDAAACSLLDLNTLPLKPSTNDSLTANARSPQLAASGWLPTWDPLGSLGYLSDPAHVRGIQHCDALCYPG